MSRRNNLRKKYGRELSDLVVKYCSEAANADKKGREELFKRYQSEWIATVTKVNAREKGTIELDREAFKRMADMHFKEIAKRFKPESKAKTFFKKLIGNA